MDEQKTLENTGDLGEQRVLDIVKNHHDDCPGKWPLTLAGILAAVCSASPDLKFDLAGLRIVVRGLVGRGRLRVTHGDLISAQPVATFIDVV